MSQTTKTFEKTVAKTFKKVSDPNRRQAYTGEIYWVSRKLWKNADGFSTNESKNGHPGLVCKNSTNAGKPIYLVPGSTSKHYSKSEKFLPNEALHLDAGSCLNDDGHFVLEYFQPISKRYVGKRQGKLSSSDRQRFEPIIKRKVRDIT